MGYAAPIPGAARRGFACVEVLMLRSFGFLAVLALAACAADTTIALTEFDTTCAKDQDCVNVQVGDICGCDCGNAAINTKDLAAYQAELANKGMHCNTKVFCDCAVPASPVCTQGRCAFAGF
jgi:hypothetical protein